MAPAEPEKEEKKTNDKTIQLPDINKSEFREAGQTDKIGLLKAAFEKSGSI